MISEIFSPISSYYPLDKRSEGRSLCVPSASMLLIPRRMSFPQRICPSPRWSGRAVSAKRVRVPSAGRRQASTRSRRGCSTTSGTLTHAVPVMFMSPNPSITANRVAVTSSQTSRVLWPHTRNTRDAWSSWPSDSLSRMAYPTARRVGTSGGTIECGSPAEPSRTGSRSRGKKGVALVEGPYLDEVLKDFSGYLAIDEVYDGPFCILVIVDNRNFHRLLVEVLDHSPDHTDIKTFLARFRAILDQRNLTVSGITTDGSPLYPEPLSLLFPGVPHQICKFHVIKEITKAILRALAQVRKEIRAGIPKVTRGKAKGQNEIAARKKKARLEKKITDLFDNRFLLVQRKLTQKEKRTLTRITRGYPMLRQFRDIMDAVYNLFDRRCKLETGLKKLAKLRLRVIKYQEVYTTLKKILSPTLEKALTFLDEKLLPSTSNGVERENRRFRKMQKSVYRVRSKQGIEQRIALDMIRGVRHRRRHRVIAALQGFRHG